MNIRNADAGDASAIAAIYNYYVTNTTVSFEEETVSDPEMARRIADVQAAGLPWLVVTRGERVLGYAYATKWRVRPAYRYSVESSVYLAHDQARGGLGTALYTLLLERLRAQGLHIAIGGIALPNAASVALHQKCGFRKVAHFQEVGYKADQWLDVGYWELQLSKPV